MSIILDGILRTAINPAFTLLPPRMESEQARVMMLGITLQEADGVYRVQKGGGPAHGLWQFEEGGSVHGVMTHHATKGYAGVLCASRRCMWDERAVWEALARDDILAAAFARLLLYTHPHPLPEVDASEDETWDYYKFLWRPGKPRRVDWSANHAAARAQIMT